MQIVYASSTCSSRNPDGTPVRLIAGEAWWADDPFVIAHPDLFRGTPPIVRGTTSQTRPVETATAVPGFKRRGRPPRAAL